jgi:hypothetical protein
LRLVRALLIVLLLIVVRLPACMPALRRL